MKKLILIIYFSIAATVFAQYQQWVKTYNGSANTNDIASFVKADLDGNILVSGRVLSTGNNTDICTIKYSPTGAQLWAATYSGAGYDEPAGLTVDNAGNAYVTGMTRNASLNYDIRVIKYSPGGTELWAQTWTNTGSLDDKPAGIYVDGTGNVYVTGFTEITANTNYNYITLKYNSTGTLQWAKQYNHPMNNNDKAMFIGGSGDNIYVTGISNAPAVYLGFLTIKYNSAGDTLWTARYDGTTAINEIPYGFAVDAQGNSYVTGLTEGTGSGIDWMTVKYNTNGVEQWKTRYTSPNNAQDIPEGLAVDGSGNVFVTGRTRIGGGYNDFGTVKYNAAGVQEWFIAYDNTSVGMDDNPTAITVDNSGNVYVTGMSSGEGANIDAVTIKYNSAGSQMWAARFDSTSDEEPYAITLDVNNNVIIAGYLGYSPTDFMTIKYSQINGIINVSNEIPGEYHLSQNYPNPFNPVTNINFSIPAAGHVKITVYDILGREITVLVNENLNAGVFKTDLDASALSSGVYFYKMETVKYSAIKKMILIK